MRRPPGRRFASFESILSPPRACGANQNKTRTSAAAYAPWQKPARPGNENDLVRRRFVSASEYLVEHPWQQAGALAFVFVVMAILAETTSETDVAIKPAYYQAVAQILPVLLIALFVEHAAAAESVARDLKSLESWAAKSLLDLTRDLQDLERGCERRKDRCR